MKKISTYIILVFALCLGFNAQAQQPVITEYSAKLNSLSEIQAESLDKLINGEQGGLYVNEDGKPEMYQDADNPPKTMFIHKPADLILLAEAYPNQLSKIELINIGWNDNEMFDIPSNALSKLSKLRYIFVRSNMELSKQSIEKNLLLLLTTIKSLANVEILYSGVEQVQ